VTDRLEAIETLDYMPENVWLDESVGRDRAAIAAGRVKT